jgi:hypothetical protein
MAEELFVKYVDGEPVAYAYGEKWVAMALYMDDIGFDTPREAREAWEKMKKDNKNGE